MVGSHVRLQTCDHFNIYLSNVGALTDISERTLDREKEGEATGWETDGETETEWLWHWSLSLWWGTGQQLNRGESPLAASGKTGVKRPSVLLLLHFVPVKCQPQSLT